MTFIAFDCVNNKENRITFVQYILNTLDDTFLSYTV